MLTELLRGVLDEALRGVFVALPGSVTGYDPSTGLATVQPGTKRLRAPTAPGQTPTFEALAPCPGVRVLWLGGGGFGAHAPLAEGDPVLLVFCDSDPAAFFRTGQVVRPDDVQEHAAGNAIAIAGFTQPGHAEASAMTLGHPDAAVRLTNQRMEVAGNSDAAALASRLDTLIQLIKNATSSTDPDFNTFKGQVATAFPSVVGGAGPYAGTSTGSAKIKTGG